MKGGYFMADGRFHREDEAVFTLDELVSRTEGFSEVFRAEHNEILFAASVSRHLLKLAGTIGLDLDGMIDPEGRLLRKDVSRLLNKNKLYLAAKIRIQLFPVAGQTHLVLQATEIERGYYPIAETGLLILFYRDQRKDSNADAMYPVMDSFIQSAARRKAFELNKPNLILLNREEEACESIGGSFGYLIKDHVYLPSDYSGGYLCAIRQEVAASIHHSGFKVVEKAKITMDELLNADELFLYDACNGIQKVLGLEERRYYSTKTQLIAEKLSELARKDRGTI